MKVKFAVVALALLCAICITTAGCGGGGGGSKQVEGVANIHSDSLYPRVGVIEWDSYSNAITRTSSSMSRSSGGWRDVDFGVSAPDEPSYSKVYSIAAFNDKDGDKKYDTAELLGFADCFLYWNNNAEKWQIIEKDGSLRHYDAFAQSGEDNVYIYATWTKSISSGNSIEDKIAIEKESIQKLVESGKLPQ